MKKNKRKNVIALSLITAILLAGCSGKKKEVDYNQGDNTTSQVTTTEYNYDDIEAGQTLNWSDAVEMDKKKVTIAVEYVYPDISSICTKEVKERYLTPEEKKSIITHFIPEQYYDMGIFDGGYSIDNLQRDKEHYASSTSCINSQEICDYIDERIENMPSEEEAKANFTDLNRGHVQYDYNGQIYHFEFFSDPAINESGFMMYKDNWENSTETLGNVISIQDAISQAEALCQELNLGDFVVSEITDMGDEYQIVLTRDLNGTPADATKYFYMDSDFEDDDYQYKVLIEDSPYASERVFVRIGVDGIREISATGLMEEISNKDNLNILDLEQIKKAIKRYIAESESEYTLYQSFRFTYLRIAGNNEDEYSYIPVWVLGPQKIDGLADAEYKEFLFVNAIDGSLIDVIEAGAITKNMNTYYNVDFGRLFY